MDCESEIELTLGMQWLGAYSLRLSNFLLIRMKSTLFKLWSRSWEPGCWWFPSDHLSLSHGRSYFHDNPIGITSTSSVTLSLMGQENCPFNCLWNIDIYKLSLRFSRWWISIKIGSSILHHAKPSRSSSRRIHWHEQTQNTLRPQHIPNRDPHSSTNTRNPRSLRQFTQRPSAINSAITKAQDPVPIGLQFHHIPSRVISMSKLRDDSLQRQRYDQHT